LPEETQPPETLVALTLPALSSAAKLNMLRRLSQARSGTSNSKPR
jgi:hypothetical protein